MSEADLRRFIQERLEYQRWAAQRLRAEAAPYRSPKIADQWFASAETAQELLYAHRQRRLNLVQADQPRPRCSCGEPDWCSTLRLLAMTWANSPQYQQHAAEWQAPQLNGEAPPATGWSRALNALRHP